MKKLFMYLFLVCLFSVMVFGNPVLDPIDDVEIKEGGFVMGLINCTAPDNGTTTFEKLEGPGILTPINDQTAWYEFVANFTSAGIYNVTFKVSDDDSSDTESFKITVTDVLQSQMTLEDAFLGGEDQHRAENISSEIILKNTGDVAITDIGYSLSVSDNSRFKVTVSGVPSTLGAGASATITVWGYVPLNLDAVDSDGDVKIHDIGNVIISGKASSSDISVSSDIQMQAENKLEIKKLYFAGEKVKADDDSIEDETYKPNEEIEVRMIPESKFDKDGDCEVDGEDCDIDIKDATIKIDSIDVDEDFDFNSLDPEEDDQEEKVTFEIDSDADEDDHEVEVVLTGEDENGALHGEHWTFDIEIEREDDEITITDFSFNPTTLECNERFISVSVDIENTGDSNQKKVALDVECKELDILESIPRIELDDGDETTKNFDIKLPANTAPGAYYFDIIAYYDNDEESDREMQKITVLECREEQENETPEDDKDTEVDYIEYVPPTGEVIYGEPKAEESFTESREYLLLLALGMVIVVVLIIILMAVLLKK
ncbi:hypothetical protein JXB41_06805 [Candidatus Woesearchaeota archaeon]|nr:hypothetical protein [Candidatus Woesearchaeota archaeon]